MPDTNAKLRPDLEMRSDPANPDSAFILRDPVAGRLYRFTNVQATVLRLLDGSRGPSAVAEESSAASGERVDTAQVESFAANLRKLLLLDEAAAWHQLESRRRSRRSLLSGILSVKLWRFNPETLLAAVEARMRFSFTEGFAAVVVAASLAALVISLVHVETLFRSLRSLVSLYSLPLVVAVAFVVMTIHELGHGLALTHFGGTVREMGLQFLYFVPAFYCNLDDAWLLGRRERLYVSLSGSYLQLFLWSLATICWWLLAQETLASRVCLVVIGFSAAQTILNFIPLIRLDGYYLLSDLLNIPNLRPKAFAYVGSRIRRVLGAERNDEPARPVTPRERRIYLVYGLAGLAFSGVVLWFMFARIGGWLLQEYHGWGIVIVSGVLLLAISSGGKEGSAAPAGGRRSVVVRLRKSTLRIGVAALLLAIGFVPWELKVSGEFTVLPLETEHVNPQVEGTLNAVYVDEGSHVRRGDLIAEMQNLELRNDFEETRGELEAKRAQLALLRAGSTPEEIARARKHVETKQSELDAAVRIQQERTVLLDAVARKESEVTNAERTYRRSKQLFDQGLVPRSDVERDETAYQVHKQELAEAQGQLRVLEEKTGRATQVKGKELEQARSELDILLAGSRKEAIREAEAQVAKLEEKTKILQRQLEHLSIRSQIDGVVATRDLRNRIGQYLNKGDVLCEIVNDGIVIIELPVPEKEIADVRPDYPITLKVRGYPHLSFEARAKSISTVALVQGSERMVVVRGTLENRQGLLKPGMTGVGKVLCGRRFVADLATRRAIRWLKTDFWEYLP